MLTKPASTETQQKKKIIKETSALKRELRLPSRDNFRSQVRLHNFFFF